MINASICLSGELCLLVCFTSLHLMACARVKGGRLMGEMRGEKWWDEGWGIRDGGGRGERAGWMKTGKEAETRGEVRERIERVGGGDKWRTGGLQNDLHTTPSLRKKKRKKNRQRE